MKSFIYKKKGMALPVAMIIGILVLITSISLLSLIDNSTRTRKVLEDRLSAKYAAEAGVEDGIYRYDLKVKEMQVDKIKDKKIVKRFDGKGEIKKNSGKVLGKYEFKYIPPNIEEKETKGVIDVIGTSSSAEVKIKVKININDGSILSRTEQ